MTTKIQRFDFGALRDFRGPILLRTAEQVAMEETPPPPPIFSEEELESTRQASRQLGYAEGFNAGIEQAKREADAATTATNATIIHLAETVKTLQREYQHILTHESTELSALVLMIAKKVAGEALDARGVETINALVTRCLPAMFSKPRIMIELHPDHFEATLARVEALLREHSVEGDVQFRSNPALGAHDVVIDWGIGQAHRSTGTLWQEIETLLERIPLELTFAETLKQTTPSGTQGE